jgi:hypothetical protein
VKQVTRRARCYGKGLAALSLAVVALLATGCGTPQFTYVADSTASTYFKVPSGWHKVDDASLMAQLGGAKSGFGPQNGVWEVAYDGASSPAAAHVFSPADQPFVFALVVPLNKTATNTMSYNELRDFLLPVTPPGRQAAAQRGFPLTRFQLLRDSVLASGPAGVHGVRVTFDYTYPTGSTDTFDQVALTNAVDTKVYLLIIHCVATCYRLYHNEIESVMTSFTVGNK